MSNSCFETSTKENIITIKKKCNCFEHSIHNNEWISSNTKTVHRWHVSFQKKSKCKIGIISNRTDEKQMHFYNYQDLTQNTFDFDMWGMPHHHETIMTLTLDLSHDSAILYCFQNYNISLKHIISNNIPKGNDIKYKFTIKQISLVNEQHQNTKVSMFSETINDACLFPPAKIASISSIVKFARHTAHCLVYGYMSTKTQLTIPAVIKELTVYYFVGGKHFLADFREDLLSDLNPMVKSELIPKMLNIIYPGTQNVGNMLQQLIDYCHVFSTLAADTDKKVNCFNYDRDFKNRKQHLHVYDESLYLSILMSLTDIIDFYPILDTNYNALLIKITNSQGAQGLQLVYKLLKQNSRYYSLYVKNCKFETYTIRQHVFRICNKPSDIVYLRQLLVPIVLDKFQLKVNTTSVHSTVSCLLKQLTDCNDIQWLWLQRECYHMMTSTQNKYGDQYLSSIIFDIVSHIQLAQGLSVRVSPGQQGYAKSEERYRCAQIAAQILNLITGMSGVDVRYEITSIENFLEFVTIMFRINECGVVGWKILNMEINKLLSNRQYSYYDDWLLYIESKCGLFKSNFVNNLNVIKNKCKGNKENAQKQLEIATKTCYNINKLPLFKLKKFTTLYGKIKKTTSLKAILENL